MTDAIVIGGGIQGCCAALALADAGLGVTLLEGNAALFNEESVANVGRIHLGFHYACDPSLATARHVQQGALAFEPLIRRWIGTDRAAELEWSRDYWCFIVGQSMVPFGDYLAYSEQLKSTFAESLSSSAFAEESTFDTGLYRRLEADELTRYADAGHAAGGIECAERSVDPRSLGTALSAAIAARPEIEVRTEHYVNAIDPAPGGWTVTFVGPDGEPAAIRAARVVNAAGISREWLDGNAGHPDTRPRNHRLKSIARIGLPAQLVGAPPLWFGMGNHGVVCGYGGDSGAMTYLPLTVLAESDDTAAPREWEQLSRYEMPVAAARELAGRMAAGLAAYIPAMADADLRNAHVLLGEVECDAGSSDDPDSPACGAHRRADSGVRIQAENYYSIEAGKLTMAPLHAHELAQLITGL